MADWIVITGASSGVGEACATRFAAKHKASLLLIARREEELERVQGACLKLGAGDVLTQTCDFLQLTDVERLGQRLEGLKTIRALINSAGTGGFASVEEIDSRLIDQVLNTNVRSIILLVGHLIKRNLLTYGSSVINLSSEADSVGFENAALYCASKGAVKALSLALNAELHEFGIRVCNLAPGKIDSHFNSKKPGMRPKALSPSEVAEVIEFIVMSSPNIEITDMRIRSLSIFI